MSARFCWSGAVVVQPWFISSSSRGGDFGTSSFVPSPQVHGASALAARGDGGASGEVYSRMLRAGGKANSDEPLGRIGQARLARCPLP